MRNIIESFVDNLFKAILSIILIGIFAGYVFAQTVNQQEVSTLEQQVNSDINAQVADNSSMSADQQDIQLDNSALQTAQTDYNTHQADYAKQQTYIEVAEGFLASLSPQMTTTVNWDTLANLKLQGMNWTDINATLGGNINWQAVNQINGTTGVNWNGLNWNTWFGCEGQGVNWSAWALNGGSC